MCILISLFSLLLSFLFYCLYFLFFFFFFNDTATTEIYTLSLHDALPILFGIRLDKYPAFNDLIWRGINRNIPRDPIHVAKGDRKSTRLNSSHANISYAVFCLKKKKQKK